MKKNRGKMQGEWVKALCGRFERGYMLDDKYNFIVQLVEIHDWFNRKWSLKRAEDEIRRRMAKAAAKQ